MNTPTATFAQIRALDPCEDEYKAVRRKLAKLKRGRGAAFSIADARKAGVPIESVHWAIDQIGGNERLVRLYLADCAAHVLHMFEDEFPNDERPRKAIISARRYARGEIKAAEAAWAAGAAEAARAARAAEAAWAAEAARAARAAEAAGAAEAAWAAWAAGAAEAAWAAEAAGAAEAARTAEQEWQYERLELWFSDNEPDDWPLPEKPK